MPSRSSDQRDASGTEEPRLGRAVGVAGAATLGSRVLGLVRDQVFAAFFGASPVTDAFVVAFRIPGLLRELSVDGALSAAFVPAFAHELAHHSRAHAFRLASRVAASAFVVLTAVAFAAAVAAGPLVAAVAPGFDASDRALAAGLARIMLPIVPLAAIVAVASGVLNTLGTFALPALAPALWNAVAIAAGATFALLGLAERDAISGWAVAALVGTVAQIALVALPLRAARFRPRLELGLRDRAVARVAATAIPATLGLAGTQLNVLVTTVFASSVPGANSWLAYAYRLAYLPIGVVAAAVGTVSGVAFAKRAAARDLDGLRHTLRSALRLLFFFALPATIGLMVLAEPIVSLLFERGRFAAVDTVATAGALRACALAPLCYALVRVIAPACYALGRAGVPALAALASVGCNVALAALLTPALGFRGAALALAGAGAANALVLAVWFERRVGGLFARPLGHALLRALAASLLMALVAATASALAAPWAHAGGLGARLLAAALPALAGAVAYVVACRALRVAELRAAWRALTRRPP